MTINWIANKKINYNNINSLLKECEETNQFTNGGPTTRKLEQFIKDKFKINKSVICVCNATAGIHALVNGIDLYHDKRTRWATQSFTFPPSAQGMLYDTKI